MNNILFILILSFATLFSQENTYKYELTNLELNNKYPSFGTSFYGGNKIVFTTSKSGRSLDLYIANINGENVSDYSLFSKSTKTNVYETNASFTKDKKTMYFTRSIYGKNNTKINKKNKKASIAIFKATLLKDGKWGNIKPMPFNSSKYDVAHPTVNSDGTILYFTSNMPGTLGDNDIFEVQIDKNGFYTEPRNLGKEVNTKGKEMFPFLADDGFLYYSSNGHKDNYGGLDVYYVKINGSSATNRIHLPEPINGRWDDFSYIFNSKTRTGFLSSNRPGGKGEDDIYLIKEIKEEQKKIVEKIKNCEQNLVGIVHYKNIKDVISSAVLVVKDATGKIIKTLTTRSNARYSLPLKCSQTYTIITSRDGYKTGTTNITTGNKNYDVIKKNIHLDIDEEIMVHQVITGEISFSFNASKLLDSDAYNLEKAVILMNQNQKLKVYIESHTDTRGKADYNMQLTENRVAIVSDYFINAGIDSSRIISKPFGETKPLNKCKNKVDCSTKEHLVNRRTTYKLDI